MKYFGLLLVLIACSSPKTKIPGYSGTKLTNMLKALEGKSRLEARRIMGLPAVEGRCKLICGPKDIYRMIYPEQDTDSFYLEVTAKTDAKIDCVVLDFYPDFEKKQFIFKTSREAKDCNSANGEIQFLKTYMMNSDGIITIKK